MPKMYQSIVEELWMTTPEIVEAAMLYLRIVNIWKMLL